jgi:uncharacterized RDD family membrane protein YckC
MTEQQAPAWEAPEELAGPAPGLAFGGFGARLLAYLVDTLILVAVITVLVLLVAIPFAGSGGNRVDSSLTAAEGGFVALVVLIVLVVTVGYFPWFWSRGGATPGMRLMNLRVVRDSDGGPLSVGQAFLRLVGYWVSSFVLYLGFIWIFVDKRRRGWHDLIAGTVVVKKL